ncbi:hypothetical protein [Kosakonia cowanii]|uniref:hypothetical protein n=1 Tax=Kosakonia cowanii TaxID=208223 RepID=UPI00289AFE50|nr:hypothetical protein [Kosakonia cowanii]
MKERPMIFNAEMVRAILDGRKTQTRRIMKVQPENVDLGLRRITDSSVAKEVGMYFWCLADACGVKHRSNLFSCPFGEVGDRIWVREAWARYNIDQDSHDIAYRATTPEDWPEEGRWRPSIHMPRWASRIMLEITGVRVERLNNTSHEDAEREGIHTEVWDQMVVAKNYAAEDGFFQFWSESMPHYVEMNELYRSSFQSLWQSIYGAENWQANPWVWVIEFKRIEGGAA